MNVSKYFSPYCIKPLYLIESRENAGKCGFINGLFYCTIFTIIIVLVGIKFYTSEVDEKKRRLIFYGMGIGLSLLWIILPILIYHSYKTLWKGYDDAKKDLQSQGYNKMDIMNILQLFEQKSGSLNLSAGVIGGMVFSKGKPESGKVVKDELLKISDH